MDYIPTIEMDFQSHSPLVETYPENGSEQESNIPDVDNLQTLAERSLSELRRQVDSLQSIIAEKDSSHKSTQDKLEGQNSELRNALETAQEALRRAREQVHELETGREALLGSMARCTQDLESTKSRCTLAEQESKYLRLGNS